MSIRGAIFPNQHPFASDHALVWQHCISDGLLYGCDMSFSARLFTIGAGFMIAGGRMFEITSAENISVSPGTGFARIYVSIDTGAASTETNFQQISFGVDYAASLESFPALTQEEINTNQGAAVYQSAVAIVAINSNGIVSIEEQMELVEAGSSTKLFAAIGVTYPEGSVLTCTDGKKTFTAKTTTGRWIFAVPYAATWTVTATDGANSKSKTVEITSEGQLEYINLAQVYIFKSGEGLSPEYTIQNLTGAGNFGGQETLIWAADTQTDVGNLFQFQPAVNMADYSEICVELRCTGRYNATLTEVVLATTEKFRDNESVATWGTLSKTATKNDPYNTEKHTVSLDISALSNEAYITVNAFGISGEIYNVWLE